MVNNSRLLLERFRRSEASGVEVAGIELVRTVGPVGSRWLRAQPVGFRRELSGPVGSGC